ncbi:MAG: hypothetical protein ABI778_07245 [Ignavibacteriota bacterium]
MNSILFYLRRSVLSAIGIFLLPFSIYGQTAEEITKELEQLYSKGVGTTISFSLDGEKNSITFASGTSDFRLESPTDLIISDGKTVWRYVKKKKEVIIDNATSKGNSLASAEEILKFSSNYSSVLSRKKSMYELQLSPSKSIEKLMQAAGGISQINFEFTRSTKSGIQIKKITAHAASRSILISGVKISTLKKIPDGLFSYTPGKGVKITDLRD